MAWPMLADSLTDAVFAIDPDGRIASINRATGRLLGIDQDAVGQPFELAFRAFPDLVTACRDTGDTDVDFRARAQESRSSVSGRDAIPASSHRLLSVRVAAIRDRQGSDAGRLVVVHDKTEVQSLEDERRAAEEREADHNARMRQSAKMEAVGQLAGGVAHDFNNLLTAIRGFAELHLAQHVPGDPGRDDILQIQSAAELAAQLTKGLLAFSRRADVHPMALDLASVVGDAVTLLRRLVGENIEVRLDAKAKLPLVLADRVQIEQVLLNLASNARDAMPAGGVLEVTVRPARLSKAFVESHPGARTGTCVLLQVSDSGVGMDEATQQHLFEPFFTTKPPGEGTGLGLASVYGIVKQASGFIDVESRAGGGSVFRIYLPAFKHVPPDVAAEAAPHARQGGGTERILLVEDDAAVRLFAERVLRARGYEVVAFGDSGAALEAVKSDPSSFDALVADVVMPAMSGPALAEHIATIRPGLPALFMSGHGGSTLPAGTPPPLVKPFSGRDLADAVGTLFGRD